MLSLSSVFQNFGQICVNFAIKLVNWHTIILTMILIYIKVDRSLFHLNRLRRKIVLSIANCLTFFRLFISPIFLFVYLEYETFNISLVALPYILLFLLGISELSDVLDGYFARKYNTVTDLGKILDPRDYLCSMSRSQAHG